MEKKIWVAEKDVLMIKDGLDSNIMLIFLMCI